MAPDIKKAVKDKMEGAVDHLRKELAGVRTGRASLALLDSVKVDYYGTPTPLRQVAALSIPESRQIAIQPWEPNLIAEIEKAILSSDLGLTPGNDGKIVRISIPLLTEERRKDLSKHCKKLGEDSKVVVRNLRRDANEELKGQQKSGVLSEDVLRKSQEEIQKLTDEFIKKIDEVIKSKENEILEKN
ncbi:MAG TPA: ribosome recycling factor [Nitrospiria bacterium]|jgi:ribosome recycling factor|nr:ribosome recycling factor [Nitrospiria bacterium]